MKTFKIKSKDGKYNFIANSESKNEAIINSFLNFFSIEEVKKEFPCAFVGINQQDKRWGEKYIGHSKSKIKDYGCLLSAICSHSFWGCLNLTPDILAKKFKFTRDGSLLWQSMNNSGLGVEFVWRYYGRDEEKILEILNDKGNDEKVGVCVIEVKANTGRGKHWLALVGYNKGSFYAYDPYKEEILEVEKVYKSGITGFAHLRINK